MQQLHNLSLICICAAAIIAMSEASNSAEIRIFIVPEEFKISPQVIDINSREEEKLHKRDEGKLVADITFANYEINKPILIKLTSQLPQDYTFKEIKVDMPFTYKDKIIEITLAPTQISGTAKEIRSLYAIEVKDVSVKDLPKFYQDVRAAALARMESLDGNWAKLSVRDVQIVYLYLTTVRELNARAYIIPPDDINDALLWMKQAIKLNKYIVKKTRTITSVQQAIAQVKASEGHRFSVLWGAIKKMGNDCKIKYPFLLSYKKALFNIPHDQAEIVHEFTGVYRGNVLASLGQCLSLNIRCSLDLVEDPIGKINQLIDELRTERSSTGNTTKLYNKLQETISSLKGLRNDIERKKPMRCPEMGTISHLYPVSPSWID